MFTIKGNSTIPAINRNQFKAYLRMLGETTIGADITFYMEDYVWGNKIVYWTANCDTQAIATKMHEKIKDGAIIHGG